MSMFKEQSERFKTKEEYLNKVRYEISLTLSSRNEPFDDPKRLARQFAEDCGLNPQIAANDFGFPYFETFLHSKLMDKYVRIDVDSAGRTIYRAPIQQRSKHIVESQAISHATTIENHQKKESYKYARAMLPENRASVMEGKRRFVDILHYLGGEKNVVSYEELQKVYEERHVKLNAAELRRLFQRNTPSKILTMFMHEELELYTVDERPGVICMKLRAPRDELFAKFDEFEKAQEEFANRPKQNPYAHLPDRRRHGPKKAPLDITAIRPILPQIQFEDDFTAEALFGQKSAPTPPADKFAYDEPTVSAGSKSAAPKKSASTPADDNFNRLWNGVGNLTNGRTDDQSTDDERPARECGKNPPKLKDKPNWTRRAKGGIFTSDEEEEEEDDPPAPAPKDNNDKTSLITKRDQPAPAAKSTVVTVAARPSTRGELPSSSRKFSISESDDDSEPERDVRIKSRRSTDPHSKPVFSSSDEEEKEKKKTEDARRGRNGSVGDQNGPPPTTGNVIYPQSVRGTLSKPLPSKTSRVGSRNDDDDGVFSPYSMLDEEIDNDDNFFGRHVSMEMPPSSSTISQSRRPTVGSCSAGNNRSMATTNRQRQSNDFTSSAYSTFGSGLSSISRSMTAGRSGYGPQSQMAMASFDFLKFKQGAHERVQYMSYFISTVVLYRSPEAIEYQTLIDIIDKLDPNYEMVLGGTSFLDFIETNCPNVAVLVHRDSVVFGWHPSKSGSSIAGSRADDSDVTTFRAASHR